MALHRECCFPNGRKLRWIKLLSNCLGGNRPPCGSVPGYCACVCHSNCRFHIFFCAQQEKMTPPDLLLDFGTVSFMVLVAFLVDITQTCSSETICWSWQVSFTKWLDFKSRLHLLFTLGQRNWEHKKAKMGYFTLYQVRAPHVRRYYDWSNFTEVLWNLFAKYAPSISTNCDNILCIYGRHQFKIIFCFRWDSSCSFSVFVLPKSTQK